MPILPEPPETSYLEQKAKTDAEGLMALNPAGLAAQALGMSGNLAVDSAGQQPRGIFSHIHRQNIGCGKDWSAEEPPLRELIEWGRARFDMGLPKNSFEYPVAAIQTEEGQDIIKFTLGGGPSPRENWRRLNSGNGEPITTENHTLLLDEWRKERTFEERPWAGAQPILVTIHRDTKPEAPVLPPHKPKSAPPVGAERIGPKFRLGETVWRERDGKFPIVAVAQCPQKGHYLYGMDPAKYYEMSPKGLKDLVWAYEGELRHMRDHLAAELARTEKEAAALRERLAGLDQEGVKGA